MKEIEKQEVSAQEEQILVGDEIDPSLVPFNIIDNDDGSYFI